MFEVSVEHTFASAHSLREYKGKCERMHGHNYKVQVTLEGEKLNAIGLLYDFVEVKRMVRDISERLDHYCLNDVAPFDQINPSAENIAKHFFDEVTQRMGEVEGVRVSWVKVWETDTSVATYRA
jgi:6-pyruvoyltetrahydropterin/6-carboxytetrahydropterin synthase